MSFGFGFGFTKITAAIRAAFSPSSLFAANEPGVWYDPSDLSTLFQDAAGTTPVTAVEQPVGLMLDKSKGLVLGPELVTNGDFSNGTTGWISTNASLSVVNGCLRLTGTGGTFARAQTNFSGLVVGRSYKFSVTCVSEGVGANAGFATGIGFSDATFRTMNQGQTLELIATATATAGSVIVYLTTAANGSGITADYDNISVRELPGNHAYQTTATSRPVLSARVNQYLATETLTTQNVTTLAAQYRLSFEGAGTITLSGTATGVYSAGSHLITCTAGTLTSTVSGSVTKADIRAANDGVNPPPYQRVNTATDYDTNGFPHYLRFDGVDDWLVTNTITPGIDKAQVFAGVRKLSDAARQHVIELSASYEANNGSLTVVAPGPITTNSYGSFSGGAGGGVAAYATGFTAPITSVVSTSTVISTDTNILRVNGAQAASSTTNQGTGNYLAYPLYIGRRAGTTFPFNGHLYSLIVRFGANLPTATIENTENYVNTKTRAY